MDTLARVKELANTTSLYQIAMMCDIPYSTLKNTEKRNGQLSLDSIERICDKLGVPVYEFFMTDEDWDGIEAQALRRLKALNHKRTNDMW